MKSATAFINRTAIALTLFILVGVLVHDTRFDKAFKLSMPGTAVALGMASGGHGLGAADSVHTHVERVHLNHALSGAPRIQPREDMKKYLSPRQSNQNGNLFSGSGVLWPSV